MERVAFVLPSGERIDCLLNPEQVVLRRSAGLRPLASGSGSVSGPTSADTPLLHTGGGRTEIDLDLLFDVQLTRSQAPVAQALPASAAGTGNEAPAPTSVPAPPPDVRDLTRPLWNLAENSADEGRSAPEFLMVWGKAWLIRAVVESFAERLERFSPGGVPGRSWVRMRLVRVPEPPAATLADPTEVSGPAPDPAAALAAPTLAVHTVVGGGGAGGGGSPAAGGQTLPEIAATYFDGRPGLWRWIAAANDLDDVVWPPPGAELAVPVAPETLAGGGRP